MIVRDPYHDWNDYVAEHFTPLRSVCASMARMKNKPIECRLANRPTWVVAIPVFPEANVTSAPPEEFTGATGEG